VTIAQHCLTVLSGVLGGLVLGATGLGGSVLATPLLVYLVGYEDAHSVIGTAALSVGVTAWLNVVPHVRAGNVCWSTAAMLTPPGMLGAVIGEQVGRSIPSRGLLFLFALLIAVIAVRMIRSGRSAAGEAQTAVGGRRPLLRLGMAGLGIGMLAGFFGIGGGFLVVPALVLAGRLPVMRAVGTSLVTVGALAMTTSAGYAVTGQVELTTSAEYIVGGICGGYLGSHAVMRFGSVRDRLTKALAIGLLLLASYMLLASSLSLAHRHLSIANRLPDMSSTVAAVG
jgi:uncharacterized protein